MSKPSSFTKDLAAAARAGAASGTREFWAPWRWVFGRLRKLFNRST